MSYKIVLPRDAFNQSKLLKCIGQLTLKLHDNIDDIRQYLSCELVGHREFVIDQDIDGSLYCDNFYLYLTHDDINYSVIRLSCPLNSRLNYPMTYTLDDNTNFLFDDNGEFSEEFLSYIGVL